MISRLAEKAVDRMVALGEISIDEEELYVYGFFMLFSRLFYFALTVVYGALFGAWTESIVFFFAFFILRSYAGGIHASSETACTIFTSISLFISVLIISICTSYRAFEIITVLLFLASALVMLLSPIDSPEKRLTEAERKIYKKKTSITLILIIAAALAALFTGQHKMFVACSVSVLLESGLLLCSTLSRMWSSNEISTMD